MRAKVVDQDDSVHNVGWQIEESFIESLIEIMEKESDNLECSIAFVKTHHQQIRDAFRNMLGYVRLSSEIQEICSACKKIKNHNGEWVRLEKYFYEQFNIEFSHGYCEQCAEGILLKYNVKP
ncbi:MAG: hypothetical protein JW925_14340 [Syntrophaceae bacterium]|nr:hypothetical protein [Syntrophaceae bacterium]